MKKQLKLFLSLVVIILISAISIYFITLKNNTLNVKSETVAYLEETKQDEVTIDEMIKDEMINIDDCSEEFMEEYFEGCQNLRENYDSENILLVYSLDGILETFGAVETVEGPNNQYYLQYATKEEKDMAFEKLNSLEDIIVEENKTYVMTGYNITEESRYNSWGIEATSLDYAIEMTEGKQLNDVTVAIIDGGVDLELFNRNYPGRIEETYNIIYPGEDMCDTRGHGTHIAGTIAEGTPSNVKLLPIKAINNKRFLDRDRFN